MALAIDAVAIIGVSGNAGNPGRRFLAGFVLSRLLSFERPSAFSGLCARLRIMSGMTFASTLVRALAWPVIILAIAIIFRQQFRVLVHNLGERIKHLTKLNTPAGSLEFAEDLHDLYKDMAPMVKEAPLPTIPFVHALSEMLDEHEQPLLAAPGQPEPQPAEAPEQKQPVLAEVGEPEPQPAEAPGQKQPEPDGEVPEHVLSWAKEVLARIRGRDLDQAFQLSSAESRPDALGDHIVHLRNYLSHSRSIYDVTPAVQVSKAWSDLYAAIRGMAVALKINLNGRSESWVALAVIDELGKLGSLRDPVSTSSAVARLSNMRNQAVHEPNGRISQEQADDYVKAADLVKDRLLNALFQSFAAERLKRKDGASRPRQSSERGAADPA
jgi:hypothetical protein